MPPCHGGDRGFESHLDRQYRKAFRKELFLCNSEECAGGDRIMNVTFQTNGNEQDDRAVRVAVFMEEQGFEEEFDAIDSIAVHVTLYVDEELAGCARMYRDANNPFCVHFGRIALFKKYRGLGLGKCLVEKLESLAKESGYQEIELSAQHRLLRFYEQMGYETFGKIVYDEGVAHINMRKSIL